MSSSLAEDLDSLRPEDIEDFEREELDDEYDWAPL